MFSRILRQRSLPFQKRSFSENLKQKINKMDLLNLYLKGSLVLGFGFGMYRYHTDFKDIAQDNPFSTAILSLVFGIVDGFSIPGMILLKSAEGLDMIYQKHIKNNKKN